MPRWLHITLQGLITIASAIATAKFKNPLVPVISGAVQTTLAGINQAYNTDGTPQQVPFTLPSSNKN